MPNLGVSEEPILPKVIKRPLLCLRGHCHVFEANVMFLRLLPCYLMYLDVSQSPQPNHKVSTEAFTMVSRPSQYLGGHLCHLMANLPDGHLMVTMPTRYLK